MALTQDEQDLQAIDKEIERYQALSEGVASAKLRNDGGYQDRLAEEFGAGRKTNIPFSAKKFVADRDQLDNILSGRLSDLTKQRAAKNEAALNTRMGSIADKETMLRGDLSSAQTQMTTALDQQLQGALADAGLNANMARQAVGASMAGRGLLRSTTTVDALGNVTLGEQEEKSRLKTDALLQKQGVQDTVAKNLDVIDKKREMLATNRNLAELQSYDDLGFHMDTTRLQDQIKLDIHNARLSARDNAFFAELAGGIVSGAAKIFTGGLF